MKNSNICKFTLPKDQKGLDIDCFVFESNPEAMKIKRVLSANCVMLITDGSGSFSFKGEIFSLEKGDLIFGFQGENFFGNPNSDCKYMYINFSGNRAEELFRRFVITPKTRCFKGFDGIIPLWRDSLLSASEATIDLASESILLYTFSRLFKNATSRDSLISKLLEISDTEFTDPDLSVTSISDALGYNPKYISHVFKEKMGVSYSEYLRNLRIKYAVSLFDHGIDSVKNVAFLSGFSDPLYFSTVFKKSLGVSPKDYKSKKE